MQLTLEYLRTRVQFDRPIGAYQALKHPMVEIAIALEFGRSLLYRAATLADQTSCSGRKRNFLPHWQTGLPTATHRADQGGAFMNVDRAGRTAPLLACALALGCSGNALQPPAQDERAQPVALRNVEPTTQGLVELGKCANTECEAMGDDRPTLEGPEYTCNIDKPVKLRTRWSKQLFEFNPRACDADPLPCLPAPNAQDCGEFGPCYWSTVRVAGGPEDTLWALIDIYAPPSEPSSDEVATGLWLAHLAPDGRPLSGHLLARAKSVEDAYTSFSGELVVDERGHVFVAATYHEQLQGAKQPVVKHWVAEYDEDGEAVGAPLALEASIEPAASGTMKLALASKRRLVVGQPQYVSGGVALVSLQDQGARWVQSRNQHIGFADLVHDDDGRTTLLTLSPDQQASGRVEQYSADGRFAWERTLPWREVRPEVSASALTLDSEGDLYVSAYRMHDLEPLDDHALGATEQLWLHRIAPDGTLRHSSRIRFSIPNGEVGWGRGWGSMPIVPTHEDSLLVAAGSMSWFLSDGGEQSSSVFYEVSRDGKTCSLLQLEGVTGVVEQVVPLLDGSFFYAGGGAIGRAER